MTRTHQRIVIGHHLIFSSYGFWLANDPRGSGSQEIREHKFDDLGPILPGRQKEQPSRTALRQFYERATPRLDFAPLWFDETLRTTIVESFAQTTARLRYTVWACAVLSNHAHLCIRQHRDHYETIWTHYAASARDVINALGRTSSHHPIWANRPYSIFLYTPDDVYRTVGYIEKNPIKEGLSVQHHAFVKTYTGWPFPRPS